MRVPDDLWEAASAKADALGLPLSVVIRQLLEDWLAENDEQTPS